MRLDTYALVTLGIILACLAYSLQKTVPWLASISALVSAFIFIKAANRLKRNKKQMKMEKGNNKTREHP